MKTKIEYLLTIFILLCLLSCSKDNEINKHISVINTDDVNENAFDKYLQKTYVEPYNINFRYRWKSTESNLSQVIVPPTYENSVRMANMIKYLCFEPYEEVAPPDFLKKYFPKSIFLIGSSAYRNNGSSVLGTADRGLKISLYAINKMDVKNIAQLNRSYFRTIYHEFSHILHQTTDYSVDFKKISAKDYVGDDWNKAWGYKKPSLDRGFISDYASKNTNEDFVELIAHYISNSKKDWDDTLDLASESGGKAILEKKIAIVKSYMKSTWKIDLDKLREVIQERSSKLGEQDFDDISI